MKVIFRLIAVVVMEMITISNIAVSKHPIRLSINPFPNFLKKFLSGWRSAKRADQNLLSWIRVLLSILSEKTKLKTFIDNNHSDGQYIFWPDLASAHYARNTNAYESLNIKVLPKECNPPNVPQIRPIESLWVELKCRVFLNG